MQQDITGEDHHLQCMFCKEQVNMHEHIHHCSLLDQSTLQQRPTFFRIEGKGNLCRHCWCLFDQADWEYHRKKKACRKQFPSCYQRDLTTINQRPITEPRLPSLPPPESLRYFSEGGQIQDVGVRVESYRRKEDERMRQDGGRGESPLMRDMMGIVEGLLSPLIRKWLNENERIDVHILTVFLSSAVIDFGSQLLNRRITEPTWGDIQKGDRTLNWQSILEKPENILNQRFVEGKLSRMTVNKRRRVIKALNKLANNQYKGLIKKRSLPPIEERHPRKVSFVRICDVVLLLRDLFETRRSRVVHFALDCYLILLAGQRFLADIKEIERGVLQLLQNNHNKPVEKIDLSFQMTIGKNKEIQEVGLNAQLLLLLAEFKWPGFAKNTLETVRRMNSWLGICGYSFKYTMLSAVAAISTDLQLSQHVAGHKAVSNTRRYTKLVAIGDALKVATRIVVPGLHPKFGAYDDEQVISYLRSLEIENLRYTNFKLDWLNGAQGLLSRLYSKRFRQMFRDDIAVDFMRQPQLPSALMQLPDSLSQHHRDNQLPAIDEEISVQEEKDIEQAYEQLEQEQEVLIYGSWLTLDKGGFKREGFFANVLGHQNKPCSTCSKLIKASTMRLVCIYCCADYHESCAPDICGCTDTPTDLEHPKIPAMLSSNKKNQISIKLRMPESYLEGGSSRQRQIRKLLNARHFRYTRVPVLRTSFLPEGYWSEIAEMTLPLFNHYISGQYFPPIQALPISDQEYDPHAVFGSQWGIYAVKAIPKLVLIGEYACDVVGGRDMIWCRKPDSVMMYSGHSTPRDVFLAPVDYAGYVLLVNCGTESTNNCRVIKTVVMGAVRILLYTSRDIVAGEQLLYSYGSSYAFK